MFLSKNVLNMSLKENQKQSFINVLSDSINEEDKIILESRLDYTKSSVITEWIRNNPKKALNWRGKHDETLLHWTILTSLHNSQFLVEDLGMSINVQDKDGRTPYDWLLERFFVNVVTNANQLEEKGRVFIMNQTNEHLIYLYNKNAHTRYDVVDLMSKTGSYKFIDYLYKKEGVYPLVNIGVNKKNILHNWLLLGESIEKHQKLIELLETYPIDINSIDIHGYSPVYYAIDGMLSLPEDVKTLNNINSPTSKRYALIEPFWIPVLKSLFRNGGNLYQESFVKDLEGKNIAPLDLFDMEDKFQNALKQRVIDLYDEAQAIKNDPKLKSRVLEKEYKHYLQLETMKTQPTLKYGKWLRNLKSSIFKK